MLSALQPFCLSGSKHDEQLFFRTFEISRPKTRWNCLVNG
jgi:hypothetical protein